jgi:uncharacterized protein DUF5753
VVNVELAVGVELDEVAEVAAVPAPVPQERGQHPRPQPRCEIVGQPGFSSLFDGNGEGMPQAETDKLKRVRLDRQTILTQPKPPKVRAVIHETALRIPIGGGDVMAEQLTHLAGICDLPTVEIQVQPTSDGMYPGIGTTFTLMRMDNDPATDRVQVDGPGDNIYRDRTTTTEPYRLSWERKRVAALSLPASKALILDVARAFASGTDR